MMALRGMTTRGRALLAGGITSTAAGVILDQRDLVRIGVLLLALPMIAAIFLTRARYRLSASRRLDRSRTPVGTIVGIQISVQNVSRLTTPLLLAQDALPPELGVAAGEGARFVLQRVPPGQQSSVSYAVRPSRRGRYPIGPLSLRLADPFGFCQILRTFQATDTLSVLPPVVSLETGRLGGQWSAGGEGRQRSITTVGEQDVTTRPYRSGDDRRRVHWRTTARTGELSVRREEQPWQSDATLLIDTREAAHSAGDPSASFEYAVSATASIAAALLRVGYGLRLVDDIARILAESSRAYQHGGESDFAIMDVLADIEPQSNATLLPLASRLSDGTDRGALIAVLGRMSPSDATALARSAHRGARRLAMLVAPDSWGSGSGWPAAGDMASTRDILRRAGWTVAVAGAHTPIEAAWRELTADDSLNVRRWVG